MEEYNKFEKARLIGARSLQIALGAPVLVKIDRNKDSFIDIAKKELEKNVLPLTVKKEE